MRRAIQRGMALGIGAALGMLAFGAALEIDVAHLAEYRARWEEKSAPEQEMLRARFEQLQAFSPEHRQGLEERARRLRDLEQRLEAGAPPSLREQLARSTPAQRRELWRAHVHEKVRERGRELRRKLPPSFVQRAKEARPEERAWLVETFLRELRAREAQRAVRNLGRALELPTTEIESMQALAQPELMDALLMLHRRQIEGALERRGIDARLRAELASLPDREFLERVRSLDPGPGTPR